MFFGSDFTQIREFSWSGVTPNQKNTRDRSLLEFAGKVTGF